MRGAIAAGLLVILSAVPAHASEPLKSVSVYARLGGGVYLSRAQTSGGIGGGLGLRMGVTGQWVVQLDATWLSMIGTTVALRGAGGWQREGTWAPTVMLTGQVFVGDRLRFYTDAHPAGPGAPPMALGVAVAPLRFRARRAEISVLEVGAGVGWDWPGAGAAYSVSLLEIAVPFW